MNKVNSEKIYICGHRGMAGSAIFRLLRSRGVASQQIVTRSHAELDLTNQAAVEKFMESERPAQIYLAAAKVGGIHANNTMPADFIYQNLMIQANVIHSAHKHEVQKLLFLGSSCIYPKFAPQPMSESALFDGHLEPTNEPYAVAKIAGIKLCESYNRQYGRDYRSVMPTNLYGPGDNYHVKHSHVIPSLIRRFHEAKKENASTVVIWGTGTPRREFLYVDDMAAACVFLMNLPLQIYETQIQAQNSHINVGCGTDVTISELANMVANIVGYEGSVIFDTTMPDGTPRKLMNSSKLSALGWSAQTELKVGLQAAYKDFLERCF